MILARIKDEISELALHPREREISQYFSKLLIFYKDRQIKLKEIGDKVGEIISLYEPSLIELAQEFQNFKDFLSLNIEEIRRQLQLDYIGTIGNIEPFNPLKHELIGDERENIKFVKIITPGIERLKAGAPPDILQKAIVKLATGGQ